MKVYHYVGPRRIAERVATSSSGTPICSSRDVLAWIRTSSQELDADGCVIATFVVDDVGVLKIADRRSEHVICAGGAPVRSAGEMTFAIHGGEVSVAAVSNQSTGYCPEPESWPAVAEALSNAGLSAPAGFNFMCVFRLCSACGNRNLIKDDVFECGVCGQALPAWYNCQG